MRALRNALALELQKMEEDGATMQDIIAVIGGGKGRHAAKIGEADWTLLSVGQGVAQINDVPTVKELVDKLMDEVGTIKERINSTIQ